MQGHLFIGGRERTLNVCLLAKHESLRSFDLLKLQKLQQKHLENFINTLQTYKLIISETFYFDHQLSCDN